MLGTRGYSFKVRRRQFKVDVRDKTFAQRIFGAWNIQPVGVVEADTTAVLKRHVDNHVDRQGMKIYRQSASR